MPTTRSSSGKSSSSKSSSSKSGSSTTYKPGQEAEKNLTLYVKDSKGKTLSEIVVPAGHRIPPTRNKSANSYSAKK